MLDSAPKSMPTPGVRCIVDEHVGELALDPRRAGQLDLGLGLRRPAAAGR